MTDYYRLVYDKEPKFISGKGTEPGEYHYEKIENFEEATREEILHELERMYAAVTEMLMHQRGFSVSNKVAEILGKFKNNIDDSNITSELIRWHQNPRIHKVPHEEVEKAEERKERLASYIRGE